MWTFTPFVFAPSWLTSPTASELVLMPVTKLVCEYSSTEVTATIELLEVIGNVAPVTVFVTVCACVMAYAPTAMTARPATTVAPIFIVLIAFSLKGNFILLLFYLTLFFDLF